MRAALHQAGLAKSKDEVPIGAVVVHDGRIIARAHNRRELDDDPTAHAEILAIKAAAQRLGNWRLCDCEVFVTLEPCPMCAGAMVNARVKRVVWGANDPKAGALQTLYQLGHDARLNHRLQTRSGVLAGPCGQILSDFFRRIRTQRVSS